MSLVLAGLGGALNRMVEEGGASPAPTVVRKELAYGWTLM